MNHKADIRIGQRAAALALERCGRSYKTAALAIGCDRKALYAWASGVAPSTIFLQSMAELGFDARYILTGKETRHG